MGCLLGSGVSTSAVLCYVWFICDNVVCCFFVFVFQFVMWLVLVFVVFWLVLLLLCLLLMVVYIAQWTDNNCSFVLFACVVDFDVDVLLMLITMHSLCLNWIMLIMTF